MFAVISISCRQVGAHNGYHALSRGSSGNAGLPGHGIDVSGSGSWGIGHGFSGRLSRALTSMTRVVICSHNVLSRLC